MNPLHVVLDLHTFYDIPCCHSAVSLKCAKPHMFIMTGSIFSCRAFVVACSWQYSQETDNSKHSNSIVYGTAVGFVYTSEIFV